ncbi:hypothetical protein [Serpentinicella alkaliphila]|uniref:Uncharacterized protein n=1 Tax=Serpentinicella alkaliphila TaxID=1734049 RepID=A0A4V2T4C1_9FIRM|nr:hypothetical protein [Serpentinicella alkaliphila]QUH24550.1 hypothetical protein HZR23_01225 [Serpentinicella alkaliphila]TCQ04644.1 hypothetical protein EDD79_100647 [Serpentinicella alkaliphila]
MSEAARNDLLSNFFGGIGKGNNSWLICLVLILCLSGGSGCGIGGIFGDQNLILILIVFLVLFGSGGFFRF